MKFRTLVSILKMTCPSCHKSKMFVNPNPYVFSDMGKMHSTCPNCGENFKREPGFYFGAAYVSYALTVALWIAILVLLIILDAVGLIEFSFLKNPLTFLISGVASLLVLLPLIFRLSRSIWAHMFIKERIDTDSKSL